jgi:SNF2 family DNA or RNA helicase
VGGLKTHERLLFDVYPDVKIYIMSYNTMKYVSDAYYKTSHSGKIAKYKSCPINFKFKGAIVYDECHLIGSPSSRQGEIIKQVSEHFDYRYFSSGTPADKNEKLYTICSLLDRSLTQGLSYYGWLKQYVRLGNRFSKYAINNDEWDLEKLDALNKRLLTYSTKRGVECLDVPEQIVVPTIEISMSDEHRKIYEEFSYFVVDDIKNRASQNNAGLVANLTNSFQLAQLSCDNPKLLKKNAHFDEFDSSLQKMIDKFDYAKSFNKLRVLDDIIETHCDEQDEKIIVWYYHPWTLYELENHYSKRAPFVVSSELSREDRMKRVEEFKTSKSKIILMSIASANSSTTIVEAKAMVFYETSWVYTDFDQATGRIQRPGQDQSTRVYTIRYKSSVDNIQHENLLTKGKTVQTLLTKQSLSGDEWRQVFNATLSSKLGEETY